MHDVEALTKLNNLYKINKISKEKQLAIYLVYFFYQQTWQEKGI